MAKLPQTDVSEQAEIIARHLAKNAIARDDRRRGYHEQDDLGDSLLWLDYAEEADALRKNGAKIVNGILII